MNLLNNGRKHPRIRFGAVSRTAALALLAFGLGSARAEEVERPAERLLDARQILSSWTNTMVDVTRAAAAGEAVEPKEDPLVLHVSAEGYRLVKEGRNEEGIEKFRRALTLDPGSKKARLGLGTAYIQMKQYKQALEILLPLSDEYPRDFVLKNNLAWLYATAEDKEFRNPRAAVRLAQEALLLAPANFHVWSTLSEAHYLLREYEQAEKAAREAMRRAIERRLPQEQLNDFANQLRKCQQATQAFSIVE